MAVLHYQDLPTHCGLAYTLNPTLQTNKTHLPNWYQLPIAKPL